HRPPWDARVLVGPRVSEVPPDVHQAEAGKGARRLLRRDELQVRFYDAGEGPCPAVVAMRPRPAETLGEFATISHERENGGELSVEDAGPLHRLQELLDGYLAQLRVALHQFLASDARF